MNGKFDYQGTLHNDDDNDDYKIAPKKFRFKTKMILL